MQIVARVKPRVTDAAASAQATTIHRQAYAGSRDEDREGKVSVGSLIAARGPNGSKEASVSLWLTGVAGVVLLIACANVANLLLARAARRRREIAVRIAIGVSRGRLVTQLLVESAILALLGAGVALVLAYGGGGLVRVVLLPDMAWSDAPIDLRVLLFTGLAALTTAVLTGLVPASQSVRTDVIGAQRSGVREGTYRRSRLRLGLLVAQGALSVALLVGAGLFLRSLGRVRSIDLGFDARHVLVASMELSSVGYTPEQADALHKQAYERIAALPGVRGASTAVSVPFWSSFATHLTVPGWDSLPRFTDGGPYINAVTHEFFATMGTGIVQGRGFLPSDKFGAPRVAVVNETMAKRLWPQKSAIGQCIKIGSDTTPCSTIVGIVRDSRRQELKDEESVQYFVPLEQKQWAGPMRALFVRVDGDPEAMIPIVRRTFQSLASNLPYADVQVLQELIDPQIRPWRLGASMFGLFGVIALAVAASLVPAWRASRVDPASALRGE
jgi:predicted permease